MEKDIFTQTDDVNGDTYVDLWTNGVGDVHILIAGFDGGSKQVYIRDASALMRALVKEFL